MPAAYYLDEYRFMGVEVLHSLQDEALWNKSQLEPKPSVFGMVRVYTSKTKNYFISKYHCSPFGAASAPKLLKRFRLFHKNHS